MTSLSFMISSSWPSILTSVPDHLPNKHLVFRLQLQRNDPAVLAACTGPDGDDLALLRFLGGRIGNDDAAGALGFAVEAAKGDTVAERTEFHVLCSNAVCPLGAGAFGCYFEEETDLALAMRKC